MASRSSRDVAFKFLVANHQAGYLIGRRGGTIKELQNATGAKIRLSQSADYYPGSKDRVCLIFGSKEQVIAAQGFVLGHLFSEQPQASEPTEMAFSEHIAKIAVPSKSAGALIGPGGINVKGLAIESGARLQLGPRVGGEQMGSTRERVVTITGSTGSLIRAIALATELLIEDHSQESPRGTLRFLNMTTSYSLSRRPSAFGIREDQEQRYVSRYGGKHNSLLLPPANVAVNIPLQNRLFDVLCCSQDSFFHLNAIRTTSGCELDIRDVHGISVLTITGSTDQVRVARTQIDALVSKTGNELFFSKPLGIEVAHKPSFLNNSAILEASSFFSQLHI